MLLRISLTVTAVTSLARLPIALPTMLATSTARLPCLSAILLHSRLVKNWVMKNTETRFPVQRPTAASVSLFFSRPDERKKPVAQRCASARWHCAMKTPNAPSTILSRNGVHRFADNNSDNIAWISISSIRPHCKLQRTHDAKHQHG